MEVENSVQNLFFQQVRPFPYTYSKGTWVLHFSHEPKELLSSQLAASRQGGFLAPPSWEKRTGNLWLWKPWPALALDSPAHPREPEMHVLLSMPLQSLIQCPIPASELAGIRTDSYCAVWKGCLFQNTGFQEVFEKLFSWKITLMSSQGI